MAEENPQNNSVKTEDVPRFKRTFWSDIWRKVIALLLAIATWFFVMKKITVPMTIEHVPVTIHYDRNVYVMQQERFFVDLQVSTLLDIEPSPDDFKLVIQMPPNPEFHSDFTKPVECNAKIVKKKPKYVKITSFSQQLLYVSGDVMKTKHVRVRVNYTLSPQDRRVPHFLVEPERVEIRGPSRSLPKEEEIWTESISLPAGKKDNFIVQQVLALPANPRISLVDTQSVKVTVIYDKEGENRPVEQKHWDVPVLVLNCNPPRVEIKDKEPLVVDVVLKGLENLHTNLKPHPFIDLSEIDLSSAEEEKFVPVQLLEAPLPEGVTVTFSPENIPLKISRVENVPSAPVAEPPVTEPEPAPEPPAK